MSRVIAIETDYYLAEIKNVFAHRWKNLAMFFLYEVRTLTVVT